MNVYFIGEERIFKEDNIEYTTIQDCFDSLKDEKVISLDIETTRKFDGKYGDREGLSPYLSKIVMLQIGTLDKQFVIDCRVEKIDILLPLLESEQITKVGHNIKFEYTHILHNHKIRLNNVYDTQIVEQILYCGLPNIKFGLKDLNRRYLNVEVDKDTRLEFLKIGSKPFSTKQIMYGAEDIYNPLLIRNKQLIEIDKKDLNSCVDLEMKFLLVLGDIEYKGMYFDKDKWLKIYEKKKILWDKQASILDNYITKYHGNSKFIDRQLDLFNPDIKCNIQWTSSAQVIKFLKIQNACPQEISKSTKKLAYTVNAKILQSSLNDLNKDQPDHLKEFIKQYLNFKELEQSCTTFGKDFFKYINPVTNRVHSNFKQILNTGRISSSGPNLQNIPSEAEYRQCFIAPDDCNIVNCDYSGQETVVLANVSGEENIGKLILEGGDMHCFVTKAIDPSLKDLSDDEIKSNHKDKRQIAKAAGFAIQYGGNGYTIAKNLGITTEEGDAVYDAYFKAFPDLKNYFTRVQSQTLRQGYVLIDNVTRRKSYFYKPNNGKEKHAIMKKALNYPIQGLSGSMTKYASILYRRWLLENNLQDVIFITNLVHDECNLEVKKEYSELAASKLEEYMIQAANIWCKKIPMKATAVIGNYWGH